MPYCKVSSQAIISDEPCHCPAERLAAILAQAPELEQVERRLEVAYLHIGERFEYEFVHETYWMSTEDDWQNLRYAIGEYIVEQMRMEAQNAKDE